MPNDINIIVSALLQAVCVQVEENAVQRLRTNALGEADEQYDGTNGFHDAI